MAQAVKIAGIDLAKGVTADNDGNIYVTSGNRVIKLQPNGSRIDPFAVCEGDLKDIVYHQTANKLYVIEKGPEEDSKFYFIKEITMDGTVSFLVGGSEGIKNYEYKIKEGRGTNAFLPSAEYIVVNPDGTLGLMNEATVTRLTLDGVLTKTKGNYHLYDTLYRLAGGTDSVGNRYFVDFFSSSDTIQKITPDGEESIFYTNTTDDIEDICVDNHNNCIYYITSLGGLYKLNLPSVAPVVPAQLWAGWTASDVSKFDTVFGDEEAADYSCCPICLKYVERRDACNYVHHHCSSLGDFYHKRLYNLYKDSQGAIYWCTVCDRICSGHRHYSLGPAQGGKPELLPDVGNPYAKDCTPSGGGGPLEKLARFRRLREYALELQADVGRKTHQAAIEELVEAMWNAPLVEKGGLPEMLAAKRFNIPATAFPPNVVAANVNISTLENIRMPEANREVFKPALVDGTNSTYTEDDATKQVIRFHHRLDNGKPFRHGDELLISVAGLVEWCRNTLQSPHADKFGYCWAYPRCMAKFYPEEVKEFLPAELYDKYRQNFNWKFRAGAAGGSRRRLRLRLRTRRQQGLRLRTRRHGRSLRSKRRSHRGGANDKINVFLPLTDGKCSIRR